MADIELVIKIPERIHYGIEKGITVNGSKASQILIDAVKNGIPLTKGHGKMGDSEQESVLDKIRAEIIENSIEDYMYHGCGTDDLIIETSDVLDILDKYKVESEEKNGYRHNGIK